MFQSKRKGWINKTVNSKGQDLRHKCLNRDFIDRKWETIIYKYAGQAHGAPALGGTHSWIFLRVVEQGTYCCGVALTLIWWISARNFLGSGGCVVGGSSVMQCSQRCLRSQNTEGSKTHVVILVITPRVSQTVPFSWDHAAVHLPQGFFAVHLCGVDHPAVTSWRYTSERLFFFVVFLNPESTLTMV